MPAALVVGAIRPRSGPAAPPDARTRDMRDRPPIPEGDQLLMKVRA